MNQSSASQILAVRLAGGDDLEAIRQLLSQLNQREWDAEGVRWLIFDLDPEKCAAWLAFDQKKLVGITSLFLRELHAEGADHRVAYWNNLYIDPDYRDRMLYPRLLRAMFDWVREKRLTFLYAAVRRPNVTRAHLAFGFRKVGQWRVLARPLRPARLIAKHKGYGRLVALVGAPLDQLYALISTNRRRKLRQGVNLVSIQPEQHQMRPLVELLNSAAAGSVAQRWTPAAFANRFRRTRYGARNNILTAQLDGQIQAAVVYCFAELDNQIRTAVILKAVGKTNAEVELSGLLAEVDIDARLHGCDLVLFLSGLGTQMDTLFRRCGYRNTWENYDLIVWPSQATLDYPWCANIDAWRFSLGDHDAF